MSKSMKRRSATPTLRLDAVGFVARTVAVDLEGPQDADLGTVVLERAAMLRGAVVWPDGTPAAAVLVTADGPARKFVQGLTNAAGRFVLEPPCEGTFRVSAGAPVGEMRGSGRAQCWEGSVEEVCAESEVRLELRFVPAVLVELDGPEPRPPGFHWSNAVVVARSADGRADYDWMPEDGWSGKRRVVRLYGRGPWTLVAKHAALATAEVELGTPCLTPTDPLPVHGIELRPSPQPVPDREQR